MWVPLIEAGEHLSEGADYFVEKYLTELLTRDPLIDTIILGCTHYPLIQDKIEQYLRTLPNPPFKGEDGGATMIEGFERRVISQGEIVAQSLADYLRRHPEIVERISSPKGRSGGGFLTTESADKFSDSASLFLSEPIEAEHIEL